MNVWLAIGALVVLVLISVVVLGARRPRHAEDELAQPNSRPARGEAPAALNQASVRDLLQSLHKERETGTLLLTAGERSASLYFLFGHLFHAVSDTVEGEAAVRDCLDWRDVQSTFDKKSPLPKAETIERSTDEILA